MDQNLHQANREQIWLRRYLEASQGMASAVLPSVVSDTAKKAADLTLAAFDAKFPDPSIPAAARTGQDSFDTDISDVRKALYARRFELLEKYTATKVELEQMRTGVLYDSKLAYLWSLADAIAKVDVQLYWNTAEPPQPSPSSGDARAVEEIANTGPTLAFVLAKLRQVSAEIPIRDKDAIQIHVDCAKEALECILAGKASWPFGTIRRHLEAMAKIPGAEDHAWRAINALNSAISRPENTAAPDRLSARGSRSA